MRKLLPLAFLLAAPAHAQAPDAAPAAPQSPIPGPGDSTDPATNGPSPFQPGFTTNLFGDNRPALLGDLYGLRSTLARRGITLGLQETAEAFGNPTGGIRQGAAFNGLTTLSLGLDTGKAFGLDGGQLHASAFQIHGRNLSTDNLGTLQTSSGIQAQRATRLWELWFQQSFAAGKADLKIGQQSLDTEFITSTGSSLFINTAAGWPLLPSVDLYSGGPAYPLASLGVRLRVQPSDTVTVLAGVFDDNPTGNGFFNTNQVRASAQSGTRFSLGTGALAIAELQYALNPATPANPKPTGLPGTYKLGAWYDTGRFFDQRFAANRIPLADPAAPGGPRTRRTNYSLYAVLDQTVWHDGPDGARALAVFARLMGAPGDRNLAQFSLNAGLTLKAPLPGRNNDSLGLGYGLARIGSGAIRADQDQNALAGPYPIRGSESFVELTYQYQAAPWLILQPDAQYVWTPAGGIPNPRHPTRRIGNATVLGLRTNVVF